MRFKICIYLSWLILTSQNWKEIVEKTFVRYLERKIARILKLLLIPWKLFFSQTNHIATAWKWKLAITEPTQTYVLHFRRHEHAVFSILKLWLLKQKGKHFAFSVWHMKLILCALLSRFSPTELIRYYMQSSFFNAKLENKQGSKKINHWLFRCITKKFSYIFEGFITL